MTRPPSTSPSATDAALFRAAIDEAPNGILVVDASGSIVLANRALAEQFGYAPDELVGQSIELLVPDAGWSAPAARRADFLQSPGFRPVGTRHELLGRRKDGSLIPVEIGSSPLPAPDGLLTLASVVDTTERHRIAQRHEASVADQREFEQFVAELSALLIGLPAAQVNDAINDALGHVCERHGLDRATIFALTAEGEPFSVANWAAAGAARAPENAMTFPLSVDGRVVGAVEFDAVQDERRSPEDLQHRLRVLAGVFAQMLARRQRDEAVRSAIAEVERLRDELQVENATLKRQVGERLGTTAVIGRSRAIAEVLEQIAQVAPTGSTVLLLGETGVGKELLAQQLHDLSPRRGRPMVRVNCAAIPATLIESELFGREKGAFTGALARQIGRFELAHGSTIFLDEIGDLPADVQVKLLRVLENGHIERLGSPRAIPIDTRIVAATHRDLEQRIGEGAFRADLYYRLNVFPIRVPPLRERAEDIPELVWRFVEEFSRAFGKPVEAIAEASLLALQQYSWPGNIRELRNVVERAMITAHGPRLTIPPPSSNSAAVRHSPKLTDVEREHIRSVLDASQWRIRGSGGAAERLGLKPTTLETRMAKLGLRRVESRH